MTDFSALSDDQSRAFHGIAPLFEYELEGVYAITGKAGSGKTRLLANLVKYSASQGTHIIQPDFEKKLEDGQRSLAILTPTNKASSVLQRHGVPATTLHRILYKPVYDPEYEVIADWLVEGGQLPLSNKVTSEALERARVYFSQNPSVPGALAAMGVRGSDFITGWKRREDPLDIGFVDEASMLDMQQFEDLQEIFSTLVLFGDPAQLAPVGYSNGMVFDKVNTDNRYYLNRIHRQEASNPIIDLAHALGEDNMQFELFDQLVRDLATQDNRIVVSTRAQVELMTISPMLVWRNATRKRLIAAFRRAYEVQDGELRPGEPLICDGIELPQKHRAKRIDLEARGLIKGAQVSYLGPGKKPGFARFFVVGAQEPYLGAAAIISIEHPDRDEPDVITASRMGASFIHGAASTIHKSQGSQWPEVQIFVPDLSAAARMGRMEAGIPLWKRLAYVALTRAEERIYWVTDYRLSKPEHPLDSYEIRRAFANASLEEFS